MAKMKIEGLDEYLAMLNRMGKESRQIATSAVYAGAGVVADEMRKSIQGLPEDRYRMLKPGEQFDGISNHQKQDLMDGLGISGISTDGKGDTSTGIGFEGYGSMPTKKYPKGLPNLLLARSIESGSSVRKKIRFVYRAVNASKARAQAEMVAKADEEIKKIYNG